MTSSEHTEAPEAVTEAPEAAPEAVEEVQQPADVADTVVSTQIEMPTGSLTIRPNQSISDFNPEQRAAMLAIGIDTANDPGVLPHLRAFVHMCQTRNLDPFAREAYLIGRGKGEFRKWTMQTGIDGYRKMAKSTGQFIRVKKTLWTGSDDDDRSYVRTQDEDGDYVMQRVWFDQWPANRGNPGAAKVVIEHRDATGQITTTSAVADWSMYAPYTDQWVGSGSNRQKKLDSDGKPVRVLNEMWTKGGPHMLAKCLPGHTRIQTDRGSLPIGDIVNKQLAVKVRSINLDTGEECWQPVVNWWKNGVTREWVAVRTPNGGRGNRSLRTTPDHPFLTPLGWKEAGDLTTSDMVAVTSPTLSLRQEQVLRGSMLGDGSLVSRKRDSSLPYFSESHSVQQADYLRWKAGALENLSPRLTEGMRGDGAGGSHPTISMRTQAVPVLYNWRRKPEEWLDGLDDLGLAVWFMDDGSIKATGGASGSVGAAIHCCGFPVGFADYAVDWFAARGIECKVLRRDKNPYLAFGVNATTTLLARIASYVRGEGTRKVWIAEPITDHGPKDSYVFVPVLEATKVNRAKGEQRYDIEVEGTHNFVVNNVVVHNCAEALAHRRAFPAAMSGIYVSEEMHRLDQQERDREGTERAQARRQALAERRRSRQDEVTRPANAPAEDASPAPAAEVAAEVVSEVVPGLAERSVAMLRAELEWQSDVLGQEPAALAARRIKALGKPLAEFTSEELFTMVNGYRSLTAQAAAKSGHALAELYAEAAQDGAAPFDIDALALIDSEDVVDAEVVPEAEPHLYVASAAGDDCWSCGGPADMHGHIAPSTDEGGDQ